MKPPKRIAIASWACLATLILAAIQGPDAWGQAPNPPVSPPTDPAPATTPTSPESAIEERLRKMEARFAESERRHAEEYESLRRKYEELKKAGPPAGETDPLVNPAQARGSQDSSPVGAQGTSGRTRNRETTGNGNAGQPFQDDRPANGETSAVGAQGTGGRTSPRESAAKSNKKTAKVTFDEGLEFASDDDEFKLNFHNLTQAEYRGFPSRDRGELQDQFFIPRQRWYFTGQATKSVEFYTVINRGYGTLDVLDAFMTLNILEGLTDHSADELGSGADGSDPRASTTKGNAADPRLRFRIGRMKTPFLYEYFSIAEGDLIAPERSLYAGNLSGNRQVGAMFLGNLLEERIGYAAGIFNGSRNSFGDFNSDKDLFFHLNVRPFLMSERFTALKFLNIGGDINGGYENNPAQPGTFTTASDQTTNATANTLSPTFLSFNNNVTEVGERTQYAGHVAYFYNSFMFLGEYAGGSQGYSTNKKDSTQISNQGWMVQGTYFLTGEHLNRRVNVVRPLKDFGYDKTGQFGIGAIEVHARFSELALNHDLFSAGLADPSLWTNRASATDIGANWYLNYYTKIYFDWQHAYFGSPVTTGSTNHFVSATDLFWLRFQLFF